MQNFENKEGWEVEYSNIEELGILWEKVKKLVEQIQSLRQENARLHNTHREAKQLIQSILKEIERIQLP